MKLAIFSLLSFCTLQLRLVSAQSSTTPSINQSLPITDEVRTAQSGNNFGGFGGNPAFTDLRNLSILCRNNQDVLLPWNLTVHVGDTQCFRTSMDCIGRTMASCLSAQQTNSDFMSAYQSCAAKTLGPGQSSSLALTACVLPVLMKYCDTPACSTCPSSISTSFDDGCTSAGGQLCRQTFIIYDQNKIQMQSFCAPSECSSQLLTTSMAKAYTKLINTMVTAPNGISLSKSLFDSQITCGNGSESYSVRSSDTNTPVSPSHASSQTAGFLSLVVAGAVLRLF